VVGLCGSEVFNRRVLVLGLGSTARAVGTALSDPDVPSVKLVGYFPIHSREDVAVPAHMVLRSDLSLQAVISRERIDEVIVAVRDQRGAALPLSELLTCRLQGVRITDLPVFYERVRGEVPVEFLKASHLIFGEGFRLSPGREFRKRLFDVVVSLLLFIATLPVMAVTALAIKLESPGPLIYRQQRVGRGGKLFDLLKFRSMCVDAEQDGQPQWAAEGDSRVTRVGRFIRLARIDELPQLVNVLRGEMSFVGPRPERPYFVEQLARQIPFYATRLTVKPGITGWAQVRFPYGASVEDAASKLRFDLYYVKNHSFMLDIVILLETVRVVLFGRGSR
jgi:sugar transferase (PEP-CTERM system associated)